MITLNSNYLKIILIIIIIACIAVGAIILLNSTDIEENTENNTTSIPNTVNNIESTNQNTEEIDYESYDYPQSFEDTDTDNDGFVILDDMTIQHTPQNIQNQMYIDSDEDSDGKLNYHEYYKFMYKLNYDRESYGLD